MNRKLILTADDFGVTPYVDEGIVRAVEAKTINTVSAMLGFRGASARMQKLHLQFPDLPIGLHLNISSGKASAPTDNIPDLLDTDGQFYWIESLIPRLIQIPLEQVSLEIEAQIQAFIKSGVPLDHLSYHQNILVMYAPFFDLVLQAAQKYDLPLRMPLPLSMENKKQFGYARTRKKGQRLGTRFAARHPFKAIRIARDILPKTLRSNVRKLQQSGIKTPDHLADPFYGDPSPENLRFILENLPAGTSELVLHPGLAPRRRKIPKGIDPEYMPMREYELATLLNPLFPEWLQELGIELSCFGELGNADRSA